MKLTWEYTGGIIKSRDFICGHCGLHLASQRGWDAYDKSDIVAHIYICHNCFQPTYFGPDGKQIPGVAYGNPVHDIPDQYVESLYEEARNCTASNASTAAVLCCRKLLMNLAVSKGASEGQKFIEYVEYLSDKGFIPPDGRDWVDHIRKKGNEATHEIAIVEREDAEELLSFVEMLLKFIYEFPAKRKRKTSADS
ncbi:MAG: DUF4145 domain-containing protein [Methanosarcinales archaeon]|nr:DUF4145 domain-containing protein [Methanosarcinales archaeon]